MSKHALYRFYGDTGQLLYVGITSDPARRFGQHAATKSWWESVRGISVDWYTSRPDVVAAEKRAIQIERPLMNLQRPSLNPAPQAHPQCGHCIGCLREDGECQIHDMSPGDDFHPGPCRVCNDSSCLFELGMQYGDERGWSRAHDYYDTRGPGGA